MQRSSPSSSSSESIDKRQSSGHGPLVLDILRSKEASQCHLFVVDSVAEETPTGDGVADEAYGIDEENLNTMMNEGKE